MKIFIKTLKNSQFEIQVNEEDTVLDVKKNIESTQGENLYPADQQMLIYQGKVLNDSTTLRENNVTEEKFIVIMLKKTKGSSSGASTTTTTTTTATPTSQALPPGSVPSTPSTAASATPVAAAETPSQAPAATLPPTVTTTPSSAVAAVTETDVYGQAASNLVAGSNFEQTIQQILDMGGGTWDRDMVVRALRAAFNNPERAVEYLYSGIPEQADAPPVARAPTSAQTTNLPTQAPQPAVPSGGPNANPLDLFPQGLPSMAPNAGAGNLDVLRNSPQFRALQAMVQANPHILQPMLQELGKQNPQIMRLIQEHQADFLRLINEPAAGESNLASQLASSTPQSLTVTPEEREAIERLEAMGFDRALVLQVFFACNKNEELAANYLLDHMNEFENDQ